MQEQAGRAAGDVEQEAKGQDSKQEGMIQKKVGDVKDGIDKNLRKP